MPSADFVYVSESKIQTQIERANKQRSKGYTMYSTMSYEDGICSALNWILGNTDEEPMDDPRNV